MLKHAYIFTLNLIAGRPVRSSPYRAANSTVLYERKPGDHDVVFHEDYLDTGLAAFETHGASRYGLLMNSRGEFRGAREVALQDIAPCLHRIKYPAGKEMLLLACEGGSSGAAQIVATALLRPVEGYKKPIYVSDPHHVKRAVFSDRFNHYNLPTETIGLLKRLKGVKGPFVDRPNKTYAQSTTYYP